MKNVDDTEKYDIQIYIWKTDHSTGRLGTTKEQVGPDTRTILTFSKKVVANYLDLTNVNGDEQEGRVFLMC